MASAMNEEPPSPAKLALIREFLRLNGTQQKIDSGSFLERFAVPGGALFELVCVVDHLSFGEAVKRSMEALIKAYEPHRATWQSQYENHVNWEFTEQELAAIVSFLGSDTGQHFLEGRWRMEAYVGTNTEELIEQIVSEAAATLPAD